MLNMWLTVSFTTHGRPVRLPTPGSQRVRISLPPSLSISLSPFRADLARPPLLRADLGPPPPPPSSGGPSRSRPPPPADLGPPPADLGHSSSRGGGALCGARAAPPGRGGRRLEARRGRQLEARRDRRREVGGAAGLPDLRRSGAPERIRGGVTAADAVGLFFYII